MISSDDTPGTPEAGTPPPQPKNSHGLPLQLKKNAHLIVVHFTYYRYFWENLYLPYQQHKYGSLLGCVTCFGNLIDQSILNNILQASIPVDSEQDAKVAPPRDERHQKQLSALTGAPYFVY